MEPVVFIASPMTSAFNLEPRPRVWYFGFIKQLIFELRGHSFNVHSSLESEKFGEDILSPKDAFRRDFKMLERSDYLLAIRNEIPSGGVLLELGAAFALNLPTFVAGVSESFNQPENYLLRGCIARENATLALFDKGNSPIRAAKKIANEFIGWSKTVSRSERIIRKTAVG